MEKLLALGSFASICLAKRGDMYVLHAHVFEYHTEQGLVKEGRHFTGEGPSIEDLLEKAHQALNID